MRAVVLRSLEAGPELQDVTALDALEAGTVARSVVLVDQ